MNRSLLPVFFVAALAVAAHGKPSFQATPSVEPQQTTFTPLTPSPAQVKSIEAGGLNTGAAAAAEPAPAASGGAVNPVLQNRSGGTSVPAPSAGTPQSSDASSKDQLAQQAAQQAAQAASQAAQGGGKKSGSGGGSGGGGSKPASDKLGDSTAKLEKQLNAVNPNDGKAAQSIGRARGAVAAAKQEKTDLDAATAKLAKAKSELDSALKEIKSQNDDGQKKLTDLDKAHQDREKIVGQANPGVPSCEGGGSGSAAPANGTSGTSGASSAIGNARSGTSQAAGQINADSGIPPRLSRDAGAFQALDAAAGTALGVGTSLAGAALQLWNVASDAMTYYNAAKSAAEAGDQAVTAVDKANQDSDKAKGTIQQTGTKSGEATQSISQKCTQMNSLPKTPEGKAAAALLKTAMTTTQTEMQTALTQTKSELQAAVASHSQATSAVMAFGAKLGGAAAQ